MTASVVTDFYRDGITSFIIVSSDSDFWGLIESLPKAKFLVMYEYEKCGTAIKNALAQHGIYYCAIDDFCTAGTEDMKRAVLFAELEKHLPSLVGETPLDLTHKKSPIAISYLLNCRFSFFSYVSIFVITSFAKSSMLTPKRKQIFFNIFKSGSLTSLSQFDSACRVTFNSPASSSCVIPNCVRR